MSGASVSEAFPTDPDVTINGTSVKLPRIFQFIPTVRASIEQTFNGRKRVDVPFDGDGLPDQPDLFDFMLDWSLEDSYTEIAFLERLRTRGGVTTFVFWKKLEYRYTAVAGQVVFYLQRPDAFSQSYAGKTAVGYKAVVKVNGAAIGTVNYPGAVTAATVVAAGEVSISTVSVAHPQSGATVALFKFGTAPGAGAIVTVEYHPLFNVFVTGVPTAPFTSEGVGHEDKVLFLTEVN